MADHPAEKTFAPGIRGKKPAHYDHKKIGGGNYEEGGGTGFNLQDGIASEGPDGQAGQQPSAPNAVAPTPPADSGEVSTGQKPTLTGGVDFSVPPYVERA